MPLELYMSSPVFTIRSDESLERCHDRLRKHRISSLPVMDDAEKLIGVISRTDLLRVGRYRGGSQPDAVLLDLPNQTVADAMTAGAIALGLNDSIAAASRRMVDARVHRVYVTERAAIIGVFSTHDIMLALRDHRVSAPIEKFMSRPVVTIDHQEPISRAAERLEQAGITGLVVVEGDWPVGLFRQVEALRSRDLPPSTVVDDVMDPAMICLRDDTPMHRAAAHATAVRARRIVACKDRMMSGILTGLDFALAATT
jgi:CBS domain-containing protein